MQCEQVLEDSLWSEEEIATLKKSIYIWEKISL